MARKTTKLCPVCGNEFKGTDGKITCSNACRTAASRMLAKGKKPEYWLMAKSKGQKMPLVFNGPSPKKEKPKHENLSSKVEVITPTPLSYDGPPLNPLIQDEARKTEVAKVITWAQKLAHNDKIENEIKEIDKKPLPPGMLPKLWRLKRDIEIDKLKDQLYNVTNQLK
jgi:hypothetical protein